MPLPFLTLNNAKTRLFETNNISIDFDKTVLWFSTKIIDQASENRFYMNFIYE